MRKFNIDCRDFPQFMEYFQLLASSMWKCIGFQWSIRMYTKRKGHVIFSSKNEYEVLLLLEMPSSTISNNSSSCILSLTEEDRNNLESKAILPPNLQSLVSWVNAFIMTKKMDLKLVWDWCIPTFYLLLLALYWSIMACSQVWGSKRDICDAMNEGHWSSRKWEDKK